MEREGLKQQDLAQKLGVAQSSVADWVNGHTFPRHKRLAKIAKALKTTVHELIA